MTSRRTFLKTTGVATMVGVGLAGCLGDDETELRMGIPVGSEVFPIGPYASRVADEVAERTDEQVEIEISPGGELGTSAEHVEGVSTGTIDMTIEPHDLLDADFGVVAFPYLYDDYEEMMEQTNPYESEVAQEINETSIDDFDFRALTYLPSGNRTLQLTGDTVCVPDDLAGRTVRSPESAYFISMIEGLGADTTSIDFAEVSTALATDAIDGVEFYAGVTYAAGLFEELDVIVRTNHTQYPMVVGINESSWDGLTDDQQDILIEVTEAERQTIADELIDDEAEVLDSAREQGLVVEDEDGCLEIDQFEEQCQANMLEAFPHWEETVDRLQG